MDLMESKTSLFFMFSNQKLMNVDGNELSHEELLNLWEFYNLMKGSRNSSFIIRGDSDKNLMRQFNVDTHSPRVLAECLFMTGVKGRQCWTENGGFDPDDYSTENFVNICRSLVRYIDNGLKTSGSKARKLKVFCDKNKEFCKGLMNGDALIKIYDKLKPENKRKVCLSYLALAHTINDPVYRDTSGFVSTTTNPEVADMFSKDIYIYGWVPRRSGISLSKAKTIDLVDINNIGHTGLPYYEIAVFPYQEEIALRCGLLPHFIIGFSVGDRFYVNPAIFSVIEKMHKLTSFKDLSEYKTNLQLFGLEINQQNFVEFCKNTNFKRYYIFDGEEYKMFPINLK